MESEKVVLETILDEWEMKRFKMFYDRYPEETPQAIVSYWLHRVGMMDKLSNYPKKLIKSIDRDFKDEEYAQWYKKENGDERYNVKFEITKQDNELLDMYSQLLNIPYLLVFKYLLHYYLKVNISCPFMSDEEWEEHEKNRSQFYKL